MQGLIRLQLVLCLAIVCLDWLNYKYILLFGIKRVNIKTISILQIWVMFGLYSVLSYFVTYSILKQVVRAYTWFYPPLYNEMSVHSQENERSCNCVLEISLLRLFADFLFGMCGIFEFSFDQNSLQTVRLNQIDIYYIKPWPVQLIQKWKQNGILSCIFYRCDEQRFIVWLKWCFTRV